MYSSIRRSWALVSSDRPTTRPASSTAISPTWPAELLEHAVALGSDLFLGAGHGRLRLLLGLGLEVGAELLGGAPGLLDDPVGLVSGVRELLAVVGEELVGLCARGLGLLEVALDLLPTLVEQRCSRAGRPTST